MRAKILPRLSHEQQGKFLREEKRGREKDHAAPEAPGKLVPSLFSTQKLQRKRSMERRKYGMSTEKYDV